MVYYLLNGSCVIIKTVYRRLFAYTHINNTSIRDGWTKWKATCIYRYEIVLYRKLFINSIQYHISLCSSFHVHWRYSSFLICFILSKRIVVDFPWMHVMHHHYLCDIQNSISIHINVIHIEFKISFYRLKCVSWTKIKDKNSTNA